MDDVVICLFGAFVGAMLVAIAFAVHGNPRAKKLTEELNDATTRIENLQCRNDQLTKRNVELDSDNRTLCVRITALQQRLVNIKPNEIGAKMCRS